MVFSTITQNGLNLTADTTEIPAQYSNNIPFAFVQDMENYPDYTPTVYATLYDSSLIECADVLNEGGNVAIENGNFTIGNQILYQSGYLAIGITLTNGDENISLQPVIYKVFPSVGGLSPLPPDTGEWQQVVTAYVDTYINPISQQLQEVVTEVANQQTQIDNAILVMGDYQIVSEDPVQIQFKKGNGDFGPTVDLGDGLASKSMANGKYYQSAAEMYSGAASNYGIQVQQIMGAYAQDGTPTPDNPVEPQFNVISDFNTSNSNLLPIPTFETKTLNGVIFKNNNDGSISLSGTAINSSSVYILNNIDLPNGNYTLSVEDTNTLVYITINNERIGGNSNTVNFNIESGDIINNVGVGVSSQKNYNVTLYPQINKGDNIYNYIPHQSSTTPVSLELRALPDGTADVWEDGNITRNVAKVTFDGSDDEGWLLYTLNVTDGFTKFSVPKPTNISMKYQDNQIPLNIMSNRFKVYSIDDLIKSTTNKANGISTSEPNKLYICIDSNIVSSVDELRAYLQSNPIDVYYALSTPTTEPLAIPTLTSYYPFTNAWCDSQVPGMITWNVLTGNVKNDELDPAIQEYINNNVPEMITNAINSALASYCPFAVGDIYITSLSANPNTKYPGTTWQAISGETLVGYLADDPDFGTLGASVGEATHTLSVDEMPSHTHSTRIAWDRQTGVSAPITSLSYLLQDPDNAYGLTSQAAGGGQAHNNIQPSRVVMIWQRTA